VHYDRRVRLHGLIAVSFAVLCAIAPAASATAPPTTVRLSVVGMPKTAVAGTPSTLKVRATDTGPLAASGLTIQIGVSKITGLGAKPGRRHEERRRREHHAELRATGGARGAVTMP